MGSAFVWVVKSMRFKLFLRLWGRSQSSRLSSGFRAVPLKKGGGVPLILLLSVLALTFSGAHFASVQAAGWLDDLFGDYKPRIRKCYHRQPRKLRVASFPSRTLKVRPVRRRNRNIYGIGRFDKARLRAVSRSGPPQKKKRRTFHIPRSKTGPAVGRGGKIRTMCVRTCDGFYFPVSFSTSRGNLERDARICASRCAAAPARLYYYASPTGKPKEISEMLSYKGNEKYEKLKNAFRYRKEYVSDCRCQPEPWSQEARQKHQSYARQESKLPAGLSKEQRLALQEKASKPKRRSYKARARRRKARRSRYLVSRRRMRNRSRYIRTIGTKRRARRHFVKRRYRVSRRSVWDF